MALLRHSSRRSPLAASVLQDRLQGAASYDRIAGFFRSSLFEVAGETLESISGVVRIVCNSDLDPYDVLTAQAAQSALRRSWCEGEPEKLSDAARPRLRRLYQFLSSGKLQVKVLPDAAFGLVHGKAGVVRYPDGRATTFLGSVNESRTAWSLNYELLWEDDSADSVEWVQEEFDALWHHPSAMDLSACPFIENDLKRLCEREVVTVEEWKKDALPEIVAVESPLYRREQGLWPHQKYFAKLALERHRLGGARLLLADQVGLGKTIQLAMAALLMALEDDGPVLVLAPKPLLEQWQGELSDLLHLPSARWTGSVWIDENGFEHPGIGPESLKECPRRIGLVSQGLITRGSASVRKALLARKFTCVIVDEAHRARRKNLPRMDAGVDEVNERPEPNNLMAFLLQLGKQTKSLLLATATPVQLHPVEAWDHLRILAEGTSSVLGAPYQTSPWWRAAEGLAVSMGDKGLPSDPRDAWSYVRDPLPSGSEDRIIAKIRDRLDVNDFCWSLVPEDYAKIPQALRTNEIETDLFPDFASKHNPLLRHIVRRSRQYLEEGINPVTKEPWLPKVEVKLFGEERSAALGLTSYLAEAYLEAEKFCDLLAHRVTSAGFFKTLLLRRLGSSLEAGRNTIEKLLGDAEIEDVDSVDEEDDDLPPLNPNDFRNFTSAERDALRRCRDLLKTCRDPDPKLQEVLGYLVDKNWLGRGCILFSQYYDTAFWVGDQLARHAAFAGYDIGIYAGSGRSGFWTSGRFQRCERETLKARVKDGTMRILLGTDAASEGLNLQTLGSLIHIDLPWNPTRLEQRKGRIQRIGQRYQEVWIANLRYRDSVEDRVHDLLSQRLEAIHELFGQIPDTLEDVWVKTAIGERGEAQQLIDRTTALRRNPFDAKYARVEDSDWESCSRVLDPRDLVEQMRKGWV